MNIVNLSSGSRFDRSAFKAFPFETSHAKSRVVKASDYNTGLTLVEVVMASLILSIIVLFAANMSGIYTRSARQARDAIRIDALVDQDFSRLERAAYYYTYCTGSYTWDGSACGVATPGTQNYYFPLATSISSAAAVQFQTDCKLNNGTMTAALRVAMSGGDSNLNLSSDATSLGLTRSVVLDDGLSHRLRVTYSRNGAVYRERSLVPAAVFWCPDTYF